LLLGPVLAQEPETAKDEDTRSPEALAILEKVDTAIKAVHSVRYTATLEATGVATRFATPAEGTSVLVGWTGRGAEEFYHHLNTRPADSDEVVELTAGGNGDTFFLIDHSTKKAYEDMDPNVLGSGARAIRNFGMIEFIADKPFEDELGADGLELLGEETVGGEACYKIHVKYSGGQGESTWFFAKSDLLPRRRIRPFEIPGMGAGQVETVLTQVEVNIEPDKSLFVLKLPEGYEQIDDFAP
jgi:hypothetical protein